MIINATKSKLFFPNLDGLRFLSFVLVFITHCMSVFFPEINKSKWYSKVVLNIFTSGEIGVSFFFVLSGFLITYLLLVEQKESAIINIKNFYIRRILKIWPLYYVVMLIAFFIFPHLREIAGLPLIQDIDPRYCFTFLNNFYKIGNHNVPLIADVFWSVAIEEQFYLCLPIILVFIPNKYFFKIIGFIIIASAFFRFQFYNIIEVDFHTLGVISDMAIGALLAYLAFFNKNFISSIQTLSKFWILIIYLFLLFVICFHSLLFQFNYLFIFKRIIMSLIFALIIAEQNYSNNSLFKISNFKAVSKLGKYTYGLYCLHSIVIILCSWLFKKIDLNLGIWSIFFLQSSISFLLTIIVSWFSFKYFENWFLNLKNNYSS